MRTFFVNYEKVPSPHNLAVFFEIFLPQHMVIFLTDFHQSIMGSFTKKVCKFAEKTHAKYFLEGTEETERCQQNALIKLRFSDSKLEQVW